MIRAFLDTNVLFSAIIFDGVPRAILRRAASDAFLPCVSDNVLRELEEVIGRPRVRKLLRKAFSANELVQVLHTLTEGALVHFGAVNETEEVPGDPKDNHVLSAAVQMHVDYLVSSDKQHILPLRDDARLLSLGLRVVAPREFLDIIDAETQP
jgi:putative PIN family toxin of toxin-antitoxin system